MNHTTQMVALLTAFRRERNGLVVDTMLFHGAGYGLNYGVSLATVRRVVRELPTDHAFARFLYEQDVRELKLAALHLADVACLSQGAELIFWLQGIRNSEMAEEAAFALLSRCADLATWLDAADLTPLQRYALWMAAARHAEADAAWFERVVQYLSHTDMEAHEYHRLWWQAAVLLGEQVVRQQPALRMKMTERLSALGHAPWEEYLREELTWRLAY